MRTPDDFTKSWWDWENATGDWGGARAWLLWHGVIPRLDYTIQLFSNVHGGRRVGTQLAATLDVAVTVDFDQAGLWRGGTAYFLFQDARGQGVADEVGSVQPIGTLDRAGEFARMSAYTFQQSFLDDRLTLQFGKSDANGNFADSELTGYFLNGGISPPLNVPMPTYPDEALGAVLQVDPSEALSLQAGVYGGEVDAQSFSDAGLFSGKVFAIAELSWSPDPFELPAAWRLGAWLREVDTPDLAGGAAFARNHGFYLLLDQVVYIEDAQAERLQGLGLWFQLSWAPPDRNPIDWWVGGGAVYLGLLPGRDEDLAGFGVTSAALTPQGPGPAPGAELSFEWFYLLQLTPWLEIQPDIEWVVDPAGSGRNALVVGAEWTLRF